MDEHQNCETCKWGRWYRNGYDITMMDEECGGCCSWNSKWEPTDDLTAEMVKKSMSEEEVKKAAECCDKNDCNSCPLNGKLWCKDLLVIYEKELR